MAEITFLGFAAGIGSGMALNWARELVAERRERKRKQKALWRACAIESEATISSLDQLKWMHEMVEQGHCPMSISAVNSAGGRIAERLIELDPANIEAYASIIVRTAQLAQKGEDLRKELAVHATATREERGQRRGMVDAELLHAARMLQREAAARLRVLRVLRDSVPSDRASTVISRAEADCRTIDADVDAWEEGYAERVGLKEALSLLRNVRPRV